MIDWLPDQRTLYIVTSARHGKWREIVAFPRIRQIGKRTLLSFVNDHEHVLSGRIESVSETTASYWLSGNGGEEQITIRAMTDHDFYEICVQRRLNNWAVPRSKEELFSWYAGKPDERQSPA